MKVGDYVRTESGEIGEIIQFSEYNLVVQVKSKIILIAKNCLNYKSSQNIIDLIEVGDYVNSNRVLNKEDYLLWVFDNEKQDTLYYNEGDIKSIVTKEQFESMEYKVGDE